MYMLTVSCLTALLSVGSASALSPNKRYFSASISIPTKSCDGNVRPSTTGICTISGLPNPTGSITITTAPAPTSWSKPPVSASWQVILNSAIEVKAEPGIDIYDIDLDSNQPTFDSLLAEPRKYIICYFSAGTSESYRSDVACFNRALGAQDYGCNYGGASADEFWLNTSSIEVRKIMQNRIAYAQKRGCSAIDPDNIDGYSNNNGIGANQSDAIDFVKFLSREARSRGMGISLKNSLEILPKVLSDIDFAVNEQCIEYGECESYSDLFSATKPVFNIEYPTALGNGATPPTTWSGAQATARCNSWKSLYGANPLLKTDLKHVSPVDCGRSICGVNGPQPPVPSGGVDLVIPSGCVTKSSS